MSYVSPAPKLDAARFVTWRQFLVLILLPLVIAFTNPLAPPQPHLHTDSAVFAYGGQVIASGGAAYRDFWDHKGPLMYLLEALGLKAGGGSLIGIWVLNTLGLFVTVFYTNRALRRWFSVSSSLFGVLAMLAVLAGVLQGGNFTEDLSLPFIAFGLWLGCRAASGPNPASGFSGIAYGASVAACLLIRPNNAVPLLAFLPLFFNAPGVSRQKRLAFGVGSVLGLGATTAVVLAPTLLSGSLGAMKSAFWDFNLIYSHATLGHRLDAFGKLAGRTFVLGGFAAIPGLLMGARFAPVGAQRNFLRLMAVAFALSVVAACLAGRSYLHYAIIWAPFIAIFAAATFERFPMPGEQIWSRLGVGLVSLIAAATIADGLRSAKEIRYSQFELARYVRERTRPTDTVLVWGHGVGINVLSERRSPTAYEYAIPVVTPGYEGIDVPGFVAALRANPPKLILDVTDLSAKNLPRLAPSGHVAPETSRYDLPPRDIAPLRAYISEHYEKIGVVHGADVFVPLP